MALINCENKCTDGRRTGRHRWSPPLVAALSQTSPLSLGLLLVPSDFLMPLKLHRAPKFS